MPLSPYNPYRVALCLILLLWAGEAQAQFLPDSIRKDTENVVRLGEVGVVGYGQQLPLRRTAAAVGVVDAAVLERFPQTALTQAVNTLPGVRLEERATGSYRLSIRGSTLRSPFGVRNVKVYYHDLPFTDPSGTSPLNLLDPGQIGRIEVLKGPAASVYGAGTGGVVRFENRRPALGQTQAEAGAMAGSYGLLRYSAAAGRATEQGFVEARYAHQQQTGYRQNSALRRDVIAIDGFTQLTARQTLTLHGLFTDLYYQLPGGLTRAELGADPRQARPTIPATATAPARPGSIDQHASYASQTALIGGTHHLVLGRGLTLKTSLYGTVSVVNTPSIANTERNTLLSGGGRTVLAWRTQLAGRTLRLTAGAEGQQGFTATGNYANLGGQLGPLNYQDEVRTATGFVFAQAEYQLPAGIVLTAGASYNRLRYRVARLSQAAANPNGYQVERNFKPLLSPRVALLRELGRNLTVYASYSTGFSTPTDAEIRPSDGSVNTALQPERGRSFELGLRGWAWWHRISFEAAVYDFRLRETVTTYTDAQAVSLFRNAGTTRQLGVEAAAGIWLWQPTPSVPQGKNGLRVWASYAYNRYRFGSYVSAGVDNSGHALTGTAPHTLVLGADFAVAGFYLSPTVNHQAAIPLNDANTEYAAAYWTLGTRLGYRRRLAKGLWLDAYAGAENLTDRTYSLGNDLNAFGGRYFQPAPGRSWYAGLNVTWGR